jgi:peptidoglycan L-alanyl-D-glutamate endopeptidase CwlK
MTLTDRDIGRLKGVHPDLVKIVTVAAEFTPVPFTVLEGLRSPARQKQLVAEGASWTLKSRHLSGHAVDLAPLDERGKISWHWPLYHKLAPHVKSVARDLGFALEWGGDFKKTPDGPHWQLPWHQYPA